MARRGSLRNLYSKLPRKNVIVTNSSSPQYWYANMIGKEFTVFQVNSKKENDWWVLDDGEYDTFIRKVDCQTV